MNHNDAAAFACVMSSVARSWDSAHDRCRTRETRRRDIPVAARSQGRTPLESSACGYGSRLRNAGVHGFHPAVVLGD